MMAPSDRDAEWAEWLRRANSGDEAAYRRFLSAIAPFLRSVARGGFSRLGKGQEDVEDVVQETLLAVHLKRQTWDATAPVGPWLRAIARNKMIDILRRRGRHVAVDIDTVIDVLPAAAPEPSLDARDAERLLGVLNGRPREIVRAMTIEGLSTAEAARRFGMTEGAVRVALHRGLTALAAAYRSPD